MNDIEIEDFVNWLQSCPAKKFYSEDAEDLIKEFKNKELSQHDVSRRSELLFAFIAEIKLEFADQNWDYLDFIAERVMGKQ